MFFQQSVERSCRIFSNVLGDTCGLFSKKPTEPLALVKTILLIPLSNPLFNDEVNPWGTGMEEIA